MPVKVVLRIHWGGGENGCIISLVLEESGVSLGEEQGDLCFALLLWR